MVSLLRPKLLTIIEQGIVEIHQAIIIKLLTDLFYKILSICYLIIVFVFKTYEMNKYNVIFI